MKTMGTIIFCIFGFVLVIYGLKVASDSIQQMRHSGSFINCSVKQEIAPDLWKCLK